MAVLMPRKRPVEYSILYTATLCLLAGGAVMVYSASSAESLLSGSGDASYYLKRYVMFALLGMVVLQLASRHGLKVIRALTPVLLMSSFALTVAVMLPGVGVTVNGATRWLGAGPLQFQPSELLKVALVLYAAQLLAARPECTRNVGTLIKPLLLVVGAACALLMKQPDMGTTMVICFSIGALLIAAGVPIRNLVLIGGVLLFLATVLAIAEPYRRERLFSFLDPFADAGDSGFQAVQALTAIGSGGFFGVGLGESVQKIFYLPEAHTDMILAIIGEELGLFGILGLISLYGMIGYAGLRAAKLAARPLREAARRRDHVADPLPGHAQLLRGARDDAAHRRAAAVHLLRREQSRGADGRDGAPAERGRHGRSGAAGRQAGATERAARAARDRRRWRCQRS